MGPLEAFESSARVGDTSGASLTVVLPAKSTHEEVERAVRVLGLKMTFVDAKQSSSGGIAYVVRLEKG